LQLAGLLAQVVGRADIGRQIAEPLGKRHAVGNGYTLPQPGGRGAIDLRGSENDARGTVGVILLAALQLIAAEHRVACDHRDHARLPPTVVSLDLPVERGEGEVAHRIAGVANCCAHGIGERLVAEFRRGAEPDQQYARRADVRQRTKQQRRAALAARVAALDRGPHGAPGRRVKRARGRRQGAVGIHTDRETIGFGRHGGRDLHDKFHRALSSDLREGNRPVSASWQEEQPAESPPLRPSGRAIVARCMHTVPPLRHVEKNMRHRENLCRKNVWRSINRRGRRGSVSQPLMRACAAYFPIACEGSCAPRARAGANEPVRGQRLLVVRSADHVG